MTVVLIACAIGVIGAVLHFWLVPTTEELLQRDVEEQAEKAGVPIVNGKPMWR